MLHATSLARLAGASPSPGEADAGYWSLVAYYWLQGLEQATCLSVLQAHI